MGRATALKKGATGVRPLVCHEPLRRLLTRALIFDVHEDIQAHVGPNQFAVGISGGCPAMALSVQKLAHEHRNLVFFKLDLVNAYNTQSREDALESLQEAAPELASFLPQFYGNPSQYLYRLGRNDHTIIMAREGIEQGGAAGPALFSCGLKRPLDELRSALRRLVREGKGYEADCQEGEADAPDVTAVFAYLNDDRGSPLAARRRCFRRGDRGLCPRRAHGPSGKIRMLVIFFFFSPFSLPTAKFMKWLCYVATPGSRCRKNKYVATGNAWIGRFSFLIQKQNTITIQD